MSSSYPYVFSFVVGVSVALILKCPPHSNMRDINTFIVGGVTFLSVLIVPNFYSFLRKQLAPTAAALAAPATLAAPTPPLAAPPPPLAAALAAPPPPALAKASALAQQWILS